LQKLIKTSSNLRPDGTPDYPPAQKKERVYSDQQSSLHGKKYTSSQQM